MVELVGVSSWNISTTVFVVGREQKYMIIIYLYATPFLDFDSP